MVVQLSPSRFLSQERKEDDLQEAVLIKGHMCYKISHVCRHASSLCQGFGTRPRPAMLPSSGLQQVPQILRMCKGFQVFGTWQRFATWIENRITLKQLGKSSTWQFKINRVHQSLQLEAYLQNLSTIFCVWGPPPNETDVSLPGHQDPPLQRITECP